jgi:hypothetical protein
MKRIPPAVLIVFLVAFLVLPVVNASKTTRLRLERAATPDGDYEHVPAETMPVADGEF